MITKHLGLKKGEVRLVAHNPHWSQCFLEESERLRGHLPECKLHHIGSTSIHGISAKPILDMMGEVSQIIEADRFRPALEKLGYSWKGEYGIAGRRYCVLYNESGEEAFIHLHILEKNSLEFKNHLFFRDRLNSSEQLRSQYQQLKQNLLAASLSREAYTEAKAEFIQKVLTNKV